MVDSNNNDPNNTFFNLNSGNSGTTNGLFSFNLNTIDAYAANPAANIAGSTSPTSNSLTNLTFNPSVTNTNASPTSIQAPRPANIANPEPTASSNSSPLNSNALNILSITGRQTGALSGVTSSINNFGMGLGFGSGGGASEAISPALAAADPTLVEAGATVSEGAASAGTLTGASLGSVMGAGALGALGGSWLAGALGENKTGGAIGGGIGAAAGMAFGAAGFAELGLELGSFAGPIGALVGGVGGAIFGGLFGNKSTPTNASGSNGNLTPSGALSNIQSASKNPNSASGGFVNSAQQNFSSLAEAASTALGIQFNPKINFAANYSSQHGGANIVISGNGADGKPISFDPTNPQASQSAYLQALTSAAQASGYTNTQGLTDWYNRTYINSNNGATNIAPSVPNNPKGAEEQNSWQTFLNNYKAQQNANAAPKPTAIHAAA